MESDRSSSHSLLGTSWLGRRAKLLEKLSLLKADRVAAEVGVARRAGRRAAQADAVRYAGGRAVDFDRLEARVLRRLRLAGLILRVGRGEVVVDLRMNIVLVVAHAADRIAVVVLGHS